MKKLITIVSLLLVTSVALAQEYPETGWKAKARPLMERFLGEDSTAKLIGPAPLPPEPPQMELPKLPTLEKKNTDASVYKMD